MKKKQCPNCLCSVDLSAIACPFCKTALKLEKKEDLTTTLNGFKPPSVISGIPINPPTIEKRVVTPNNVPIVNKTSKTGPLSPPKKVVEEVNEIKDYSYLDKDKKEFIENILEEDVFTIKNPFESLNQEISKLEITPDINTYTLPTLMNEDTGMFLEVENPFESLEKKSKKIERNEVIEPELTIEIPKLDLDIKDENEIEKKVKPPKPPTKKKTTRKLPKLEETEPEIIIPQKLNSKKDNYLEELVKETEDDKVPLSFKEKLKNQAEALLKRSPKLEKLLKSQEKNNLYDTFDAHLDALGFSDDKMDLKELKKLDEIDHLHSHSILENSLHGIKEILHISHDTKPTPTVITSKDTGIKSNITNKKENKKTETKDKYYYAKLTNKRFIEKLNKIHPFPQDPFEIDNLEIAEFKQNIPTQETEEFVRPEGLNVDPEEMKELNELAMLISPEAQVEETKELKEEKLEIKEKDFSSREIIKVNSSTEKDDKEDTPFVKKAVRDAINVLSEITDEPEKIVNPFDDFLAGLESEKKEEIIIPKTEPIKEKEERMSPYFSNEDLILLEESLKSAKSIPPKSKKGTGPLLDINAMYFDQANKNNKDNNVIKTDELNLSLVDDSKKDLNNESNLMSIQDEIVIHKELEITKNENIISSDINEIDLESNIEEQNLNEINSFQIKSVSLENIINNSNDKKDDVVDEIKPVLNNRLEKLVKKVESLNLKDPLKNTMVNPLESLEVNNPFESLTTTEDDKTNHESEDKEKINDEIPFLEEISQESLDETEADLSLVMRDESFEYDNAISVSSGDDLKSFSLEGLTSQDILNDNDDYYNKLEEEENNTKSSLIDDKPSLLPVKEEIPLKEKLSKLKLSDKDSKKNDTSELKKEIKNEIESTKKIPEKNIKETTHKKDSVKGSFEVIHKGKVKEVTLNDIIRSGPRGSQNEEAIKYFNLAKDLCVKGNYKLALIELEEAVKTDPAYEEAHILLSRTYLKLKSMNLVWMKN
jgi:hypothetical protein